MLILSNIYTIIITMLSLLVSVEGALSDLRVTVVNSTINANSTHTWTITYSNSVSRQQFTLYFPSCVTLSATTTVSYSGLNVTNVTMSGSAITVTLPAPVTALVYVFTVNYALNCYYSSIFRNLMVQTPVDGNLSYPAMNLLTYYQGNLASCSLKFEGETGSAPSSLNITFKVQNQVRGTTLRLMFQYPTSYFSSDLSLTWYNNPINFATPYPITCSLFVNSQLAVSQAASITFSNKTILCHMSLSSSLLVSDSLILKLDGITNPITSALYATSSDFVLTTLDGSWNRYDTSSACTPMPVTVAQFDANFDSTVLQTEKVNGFLYPVALNTVKSVPFRLAKNDKILMRYTDGSFSSCSNRITVDKPDFGQLPRTFYEQVTSISMAKQYLMTSQKVEGNGTINIQFEFCNYSMPGSTLPITFTLQFSATGSTIGVYDPYMQINAVLKPLVSQMVASQANLSLSISTMGDLSSYTFSLLVKQPLTQTPSIRIDFPALINVSDVATIATLTSCSVSVDGIGVGSRTCQYLPPNSILLNFTYPTQISNNTLTLTLQNIRNPSNPSSLTGFSLTTFYTSSQSLGLVQQGLNIIPAKSYTARTIYPQIIGNNFTVYTNPTLIVLSYLTGVDIVSGSVTKLSFVGSLELVSGVSVVPSSVVFVSGTTYQFLMPALPLNTSIQFSFTCRTPSKTGIYSVVSIQTTFNNLPYQRTVNPVTFQVTQPYPNPFQILLNSSQSITGIPTQYTFTFTTPVPHPTSFILQITFPPGTNLINGQSICRVGCSTQNITDTSSGGIDRIQLPINNSPASTTFTVKITNIINQRQRALTGNFAFKTMTATVPRSFIIAGVGAATITDGNLLRGKFLEADDYYKGNTNPVRIQINVTNKLITGDRIQLTFPSSSYLLNGAVGCSQGNCSSTTINPNTIKITVYPISTQVISTTLNIEIYGLISSITTVDTQIVPIPIQTYSAASNLIDSGSASYLLDCQYSAAVIKKACKTCAIVSSVDVCTSCYTPAWYLYVDLCTTACGNESQYETYPSSGVCVPCLVPCFTCYTATNCTKCITGFYLIADLFICSSSCNTSGGYYISNIQTFSYCIRCTEIGCISCPNNICDACNSSYVLLNGKCTGGCVGRTYNAGGVCIACNDACLSCDGPTDFDCFGCSVNYFPIAGGQCVSDCPKGLVKLSDGSCGCVLPCSTCQTTNTTCLTCLDQSQYRYNYTCYDIECPNATYAIGKQCYACTYGCRQCSSTTCTACLDGYGIFQNRCYLNCKDIGARFVNMDVNGVLRCNECPPGCSDCNMDYECLACLDTYVLNGTVCKRLCQLTNTCDDSPVLDPIIPLPGFISFFLWTLAMVLLKIFVIQQLYVPYALLFGGALINIIQIIATLASVATKIKNLSTTPSQARLLQSSPIPQYYTTALGLLAVALALNYLMNLIFIWIYCKFIKPLILPRQIDKISNNVTFIFSILTTHRFYLLAFSRLFKKPHVEVKNAEQLIVLHRILGASAAVDGVALVAGFILAVKSGQLTILYMLGIDLVLIDFFILGAFVWIIFRPKSEDYFTETKKYNFQENHITEEGTLYNDKDNSKVKMQTGTNQKIHVEDYNGEENVDELPTKQANVIKVAGKNQQKLADSDDKSNFNNPKTQRKDKKVMFNSSSDQKQQFTDQRGQNAKQQKNKNKVFDSNAYNEGPDDLGSGRYGKQKTPHSDRQAHQQSLNLGLNSKKKLQFQEEIVDQSDGNDGNERRRQEHQKATKYKAGPRSTTMRMQSVTGMKKKKNFANLQSEVGQSNVDEVDLQAIIQSKLVDRSKQKQRDTRTQADKSSSRNHQYEQISPSWFNIQNQRYDINADKDEQ